ncbi:MAG: hypothetical protein GHHEDOFH_00847 [Pseudorhodoplanes sp.]|nr:hypothetical protein [Pseudorhodoplanes sp.]
MESILFRIDSGSTANARSHSDRQIAQIAASIAEFGFTNPVLVDEDDVVIAGHGRLQAARQLGQAVVPTIRLAQLTPTQKRALALADNKIALNAGWDFEILAAELKELGALDLDFDVEITGFESAEIEAIIGTDFGGNADQANEIPQIDRTLAAVSRPGDLWRLGEHLLFCGNALDLSAYRTLLADEKAEMVFTDPPYNVPIEGHVCGLGAIKHREFAMASGEMTAAQFITFLETALRYMANASANGSIHFICMDWRHMPEILRAGLAVYDELKNLCVWNKDNGGMGSFYRSKHELVFVFKSGKAPHINNIGLGKHGRYRTNVWDYAGVNTFRKDRNDELALHPTVKPTALVADAIKDCSRRGSLILDPFGGSGTTLLAAERTGRRARLYDAKKSREKATATKSSTSTKQA